MEQAELLTLIEKCRMGDPDAQETLVIETQNRVYYHCKKFLKNEEDAQDATQDVLIAMLTGLDKLREPAAFWGWLNGITANRCKHLLTQGTKEWQIPEDDEGNSMLDSMETLDDQTVPDKAIDNAETQRLVMDIIDNLPAEQRMTVTFFYYDEMSVKDIAAAMDVSEGTVKSRLNYARKAIKIEVEKLEKKDGTKLYSVSILPFLAYFLRRNAQSQTLPPAAASAITQGALAGAAPAGVAAGAGAASAAAGAGTAATAGATAATGTAAAVAAGTTVAAGTAAGTKAAGAVAAKAGMGLGAKLMAGALAGALTLGGIGGGVYLATHWDEVAARFGGSDSADQEPIAYHQVYAQKVRELEDQGGEYLYDLVYIDEDDVPELVVFTPSTEVISLYTVGPDEQLREVMEFEDGYPHGSYYPKANIIGVLTDAEKVQVGPDMADFILTMTYYHIDATGKAEVFYTSQSTPLDGRNPGSAAPPPPEVEGLEKESISPELNAQAVLDLLDQTAAVGQAPIYAPTPVPGGEASQEPIFAPTPTPDSEATTEPSLEPSLEPSEEPTNPASPSPEVTPEPTQTPTPAYAESYAAKVEELGSGYQFALVYIDGDSTPELVAVKGGYQMDIYTYANGQLYTVTKGLTASRLGFPSYYPRKNIILEQWSSMAVDHMELSETYYQIDANHQMSQFCSRSGNDPLDGSAVNWTVTGTPPNEADLSGTAVTLGASLSSQTAILEQLG